MNSTPSFRPAEPRAILGGLLFTAGYAGILLWFQGVDVYHRHFSEPGLLVLANNVCRALFIFYLFWMLQAAGALLLKLVASGAVDDLAVPERMALRFFAGTGVWHAALLGLGYLCLYSRSVAVALTLPVVALSYADFRAAAKDVCRKLCDRFPRARGFGPWISEARARGGGIGVVVLVLFLAVLMIKGLYPSGGHDYFTHYFHYDRMVVERGDIWPNDVWYHYYYSKGAGLFFLAMLLTDPLAPQLVSFCFYAASLIVLFLFLRRIAPGTRWPWAGLILFLGLYIYTPGPGDTRSYGGWGDFEKLHELNAALILAIIWMSACALERKGRLALAWATAAASAIAAAVIINNTVAVYLGAIFALLMVWYLVRGCRAQMLACFAFAAVAGTTVGTISLINYLTTGLINEHDILLFWPFADIERLDRWGALPLAIMKYWGDLGRIVESRTVFDIIKLVAKTLRLDMLGPLVAWGSAIAGAAAWHRRWRNPVPGHALIVAVAVIAIVALALAVGRWQAISFYRYTSFMLAVMLVLAVLLCVMPRADTDDWFSRLARDRRTPAALVVACFISALISYHPRRAPADAIIDASRFAVGWYSIDKAYTTQEGWPARQAWGAIYPGARGAYGVAGPHIRIWSMHTFSYCMLPDCQVESWPSFIMTRDWDRLMFGTPEEGRQALRSAGLDYFLFSTELWLNDPLPLSPLFAPDTVARYLGLRWSDGTTSLLTWIGPDTQPLDAAWLARYRNAVANSGAVQSFPYAEVRDIYARLRSTPHPWRSFPLPWSRERR